MEFLYPISRQFPFDEVCGAVVRALRERNWQVPGITVRLDEYGSGAQKFRMVREVEGADFLLRFSRPQRTMPGGKWNDTAAVSDLIIPKKELNVYDDNSGPTFYLYVGDDWERDRHEFMHHLKVNSKLYGEPRRYLCYKGDRGSSLVHDNDLGREYSPGKREPKSFKTAAVMHEFERYMEKTVMPAILACPVPDEQIDVLAMPKPIPFPATVGPLFCFGEYNDGYRIMRGKGNINQLALADRYGMPPRGWRLVPFGTPGAQGVPDIAREGFLWCGIGEVTENTPPDSLVIAGERPWATRDPFIIRVTPKTANGIYVADHAAYEEQRAVVVGKSILKGQKRLTDAEVGEFVCARGRTIIPITEYSGGFAQPVVLIARELDLDEVEVVCGPDESRMRA